MSTLNVLKFDEFYALLQDYISHPMKNGCLGIMGAPGTAKTAGVEFGVAATGKGLSYVPAPLVTPGELLGVGFPTEDRKFTDFLPSRLVLEENVLFVDELPNAPRSTMNVMNRILLNGELYNRKFPQARIWAGNPVTVSQMAEVLPEILVNKSVMFSMDYRYSDLVHFGLNEGYEVVHPVVTAFVAETRDRYLQVKAFTPLQHDGVATPAPGEPFPSPRSFVDLLTDALIRLERGVLAGDVYRAAYATIGAESGKAFGDYYTMSAYLPRASRILAGSNEEFPAKAYIEGKIMGSIQMMAIYMLLAAAHSDKELANACEWVYEKVKAEEFGQEILRVFTAAIHQSRFRMKATSICRGVGERVFGKEVYLPFIKSMLEKDQAAGVF